MKYLCNQKVTTSHTFFKRNISGNFNFGTFGNHKKQLLPKVPLGYYAYPTSVSIEAPEAMRLHWRHKY